MASRQPEGIGDSIKAIVADPRKFIAYVLVPGHPSGKDRTFLGRLGFRPMSGDDAEFLTATFVAHAWSAVSTGAIVARAPTAYGVPITSVVTVRGVAMRTGWLLRSNGVLELVTPFSGFARPERENER